MDFRRIRPFAALGAAFAAVALAAACAEQSPLAPIAAAPAAPRADATTGCKVNDAAFSATYRNDLNLDLNDYGRILADADDSTCALNADYALSAKLQSTLAASAPYQGWLKGAHVALIFAAANRIGANGYATKQLDSLLQQVEVQFGSVHDPANLCSKESTNTCMDDEAIAASGYAWIAAYKHRRGDSGVSTVLASAKAYIDSTFSEACLHTGDTTAVLCNSTVSGLSSGAKSLSLNHGQQMPSYGFGLMANISAAVVGWQAATDTTFKFTADQKSIAQAMFKEMQAAVTSSTPWSFVSTCADPDVDGAGKWELHRGVFCGGPDNYAPNMYRLDEFYTLYMGGVPSGGYSSDTFDSSLFDLSGTGNGFYSFGRQETYQMLGYDWLQTPREYLPFDTHDPIGYFDGVSATGVAVGWTCDQDAPGKAVHVDLYAGGAIAVNAIANVASEPAVNSACGGGNAHRFSVQLPSWTKGQSIAVYGLDYTWYGVTLLTCLNSPASTW